MDKKCAKCGRPIATKKYHCDECIALEETIEVTLELTLDELGTVTCALANTAARMQYGPDPCQAKAETLEKVAEAFRSAPEDERRRKAEDAYVQWRQAQE